MIFQRKLEGHTLSADCGEDLRVEAESVLDKLSELNQRGPKLIDGARIQFGWSTFSINADGETLIVCEPDFKGDPSRSFIAGIDTTVRVLRDQSEVLHLAKAQPVDVRFDDKIVLQKGSLQVQHIYLERKPVKQPHDSGWYIGPTNTNARTEDFEAIHVYNLLSTRPALLKALTLPWSYLAVFNGDQLQAIADDRNKELWHTSRPNEH